MATINLGLVKAIFVSDTPPSNTAVLWRDTSEDPDQTKQYYDGQWRTIDPGAELRTRGTPSASSGDESTTGLVSPKDITRYARVWVEGYEADLGDGVKTGDCYFSDDGGSTAKLIADILQGDTLYWNGATGPTELTGAEIVIIHIL